MLRARWLKERKRQVMVDADGRGLILELHFDYIQDRDGAPVVLRLSRRAFPFIVKAFATAALPVRLPPKPPQSRLRS
jgi:putative transposase